MLQLVEERTTYLSQSGIPFHVLYIGKHGQDCTVPMVIYTNIEPTKDAAVGTIWTMEESLFMKLFTEDPKRDKEKDRSEDYGLIRQILLAQYSKPNSLLTGTINWAAYIASKLKS